MNEKNMTVAEEQEIVRAWDAVADCLPAFWMVVRARTAAGPLHVWHVMVAAWSQTVACRVMGLNPALGVMSRQARRSLPTRINENEENNR